MFAKYLVWTFCCLCAIVLIPSTTCDCNEFVCGSVVSKCLLIQSCQCNLTDCFCCRDCFKCLGRLYTECCSCLEMCPKNNETFTAMAPKSQIGEFDGVPELFDSLTAEDIDDEWKTIRFPIHQSLGDNQHMFLGKFAFDDYVDKETPNCTVIYLNTCTTNEKCDGYCASMVSSRSSFLLRNLLDFQCNFLLYFFDNNYRGQKVIVGFITAVVSVLAAAVSITASMKVIALLVLKNSSLLSI